MKVPVVSLTPTAQFDQPNIRPDYQRAYEICVRKARRNIARLAERPISAAWAADGNYFSFGEGFFEIGNWTSSFFTGMALFAFEATGDIEVLRRLNALSDAYRRKVTVQQADTMHDLGFLYSLYSVALYRLTGGLDHRATGLLAADQLAKRFSVKGGYIQAWGRMDDITNEYAGLAIIDCLMNLPLLFWAARETGNRFYREIAIKHADSSLQYFVRDDDSVCHAYRFDPATGAPIGPENYCGYTISSHWARGTSWAMYGFALAYRHTHEMRYLEAGFRLGRRFCAMLDAEIVPAWDFNLPPEELPLRDSSAAAIAACALDELDGHRADKQFAETANALLTKLCTPTYLDANPECPGLLRAAEVGDGAVAGTNCLRAKNVYASWGDYFYMEALARRLGTAGVVW